MVGESSDKGTLSRYKYRSKSQESVTRFNYWQPKKIVQGLSSFRWKKKINESCLCEFQNPNQ